MSNKQEATVVGLSEQEKAQAGMLENVAAAANELRTISAPDAVKIARHAANACDCIHTCGEELRSLKSFAEAEEDLKKAQQIMDRAEDALKLLEESCKPLWPDGMQDSHAGGYVDYCKHQVQQGKQFLDLQDRTYINIVDAIYDALDKLTDAEHALKIWGVMQALPLEPDPSVRGNMQEDMGTVRQLTTDLMRG